MPCKSDAVQNWPFVLKWGRAKVSSRDKIILRAKVFLGAKKTFVIIVANVYRKATYTGLIMQYTSICPKSWKLGLINFYLNRALNIRSNSTAFKDELTKIKNLLINNKYPKNLIESKINKFLDAHKVDNSTFKQNKSINKKKWKENRNQKLLLFHNSLRRQLLQQQMQIWRKCYL